MSVPVVHRGLLWLEGEPRDVELLARDPQLAPFVVARPDPRLLGFLPGARAKVLARLNKLGQPPRRVVAP